MLAAFSTVVVATNFDDPDLAHANAAMWRRHVPECVLIDSFVNRGHSIGTADLENALFDWCKTSGTTWLCKSANDMLLTPELFTIPVEPASFYFLNAVSYAALAQRDFDLSLFGEDFLFPQTTFYVVNVDAAADLYDKAELERAWETVLATPDYSGRIWEYLPGWSCERLLRDAVLRNRLTRCHLMTDEQWQRVLRLVMSERIEDCSFKGLQINGICHAQGLARPGDALVV